MSGSVRSLNLNDLRKETENLELVSLVCIALITLILRSVVLLSSADDVHVTQK
jgi:hypothetical protein